MKKNKESGSQNPRARTMDLLDRITGTFIGRLIFEIIPTIVKPFVARPIAVLIAVVQGLWKLAKAVLDQLRKGKNLEDEPIEAEDLLQSGEEHSEPGTETEADAEPETTADHEKHLHQLSGNDTEPVMKAEADATPEGTMNETSSTADKPV